MQESLAFLSAHGYGVVFIWVLADQLGLPLPSFPILLAAGSLAKSGSLSLSGVVLMGTLGAFASDALWFEIGRRREKWILGFICRKSLEPESCILRTKSAFSKRSTGKLLVSKFVPGLNMIVSPMAGASGLSRWKFAVLNGLGALGFALAFVLPGYVFHRQLEVVFRLIGQMGHWIVALAIVAFAGYIGAKYLRRLRFIRRLRVARITPRELKDKLRQQAELVIVDLRLPSDFESAPFPLPGALRVPPREMVHRHQEIPRDREVVLYCSCPDEKTSAQAALLLNSYGIRNVRPLAGGYAAWFQDANLEVAQATGP